MMPQQRTGFAGGLAVFAFIAASALLPADRAFAQG
jgi:hypothetical protein